MPTDDIFDQKDWEADSDNYICKRFSPTINLLNT